MGQGLNVAIVGSGPAGMYSAGALLAKCPDCQIDILDKLATPYGLVRAGVAPDHQTTKNVSRAYDKIMENESVRFVGNLSFGSDISLETLKSLYDVVIIAIGTPRDKTLGIPGEDKQGVYGAQTFVYWYNGHPEYRDAVPHLDIRDAIVIGNGNVALDVARILLRTEDEMAGTDLADHAGERIFTSPLKTVHVVGRRGAEHAQFSSKELSELGEMQNAVPYTDPAEIPDSFLIDDAKRQKVVNTNLDLLRQYAENSPNGADRSLYLDFHLSPTEILGDQSVEAVRFTRNRIENGKAVSTGETLDIPCNLLVTCIGYDLTGLEGLPVEKGIVRNMDGKVEDGVYVVGWAKRGPTGTIGTNRLDSQNVVEKILSDFECEKFSEKDGPVGLDRYCAEKGIETVSFEDWKTIDRAETERADHDAPRRKFVRKRDMLSLIKESRTE
ncbi:FAD-dependent oxidoreductase [Sneathiella chinensis]|uniref:NADP oxidoreductase n=1 Tax=Sneathiella chinensis TaxID=349750 RepID=A0ABQ5U779_9PROT|nr:FAD-dependent oxidoreductase [Sneathiella chinensis]GLQ07543.1 NADP oxidoreductase [Sneathiella chinensis]